MAVPPLSRRSLLPYLQLVRAGLLISPAADVVAGLCLAGLPWSVAAARAALASVCIYAGGMVCNDHADHREDARHRPERPIPAGKVRPTTALLIGLAALLLGLLLSPWWPVHAVLAVLVLGYNYRVKRVVAAAALTMGCLRGLNLLAGVVAVTHGLPSDPATKLPLLAAASGYALYIAAVTLLGVLEDHRRPPARAVHGLLLVPPLVTVLVVASLPQVWPATAIAIVLGLLFARRVRHHNDDWDGPAIRAALRWLLLGTMLYTSLLCLGSGHQVEAAAIAVAILPARWISQHLAIT